MAAALAGMRSCAFSTPLAFPKMSAALLILGQQKLSEGCGWALVTLREWRTQASTQHGLKQVLALSCACHRCSVAASVFPLDRFQSRCIYIPGPSKRNIFLLITLFLLILPIERNFRNLRGNCKFHVPHPCCGKSCKFGHQKCAEIGGKCAEIGGKCAEIGGKCAEIGGKPKTNLF